MTPAIFSVLNQAIFGDPAPFALGAYYGHRPDAKTYLFSASVSHVRFQFGRTHWPYPTPAKTLVGSLDYGHRLMVWPISSSLEVVSGVQGSIGYGVMNYMDGSGLEGTAAGLLLATGARVSGPGFRLTPYLAPAYFFARQKYVGFECGGDCDLSESGFRFSFGGGLRLDLLKRVSFEAGIRKTQTSQAISRRSYGLSYRFGNTEGRGLKDAGTFTLQMDNDFLARYSRFLDEDYTQGFHFAFNRREAPAALERAVGRFDECHVEQECAIGGSVLVGQEIYTPRYYPSIESGDRPFAGWLYAGVQSSSVSDSDLASLSLKLGVTGPPSLAQQLQVSFHQLNPNYVIPTGWSDQLEFEPGVILTAAKKNFVERRVGSASIGLITSGSMSLGNILSDVEGGLTVRAGLNSHPWKFERERRFGGYVSLGVREDFVLHNLFLDGNTFRGGPRVKRVPFVWQHELAGGISISSTSLDYRRTVRSQEFTAGRPYLPYGTVSVTRHGAF